MKSGFCAVVARAALRLGYCAGCYRSHLRLLETNAAWQSASCSHRAAAAKRHAVKLFLRKLFEAIDTPPSAVA